MGSLGSRQLLCGGCKNQLERSMPNNHSDCFFAACKSKFARNETEQLFACYLEFAQVPQRGAPSALRTARVQRWEGNWPSSDHSSMRAPSWAGSVAMSGSLGGLARGSALGKEAEELASSTVGKCICFNRSSRNVLLSQDVLSSQKMKLRARRLSEGTCQCHDKNGAVSGIRTHDHPTRRETLYRLTHHSDTKCLNLKVTGNKKYNQICAPASTSLRVRHFCKAPGRPQGDRKDLACSLRPSGPPPAVFAWPRGAGFGRA